MSATDEVTYGIDMGAPNGDKTALSIKTGKQLFTYVGEEAEAILALKQQWQREARIAENKLHKSVIHRSDLGEELSVAIGICDDRIATLTDKEDVSE